MRSLVLVALAACLVNAIGCESTGRTLRLGTEKSFDGLVEVENARVGAAWIRPDFDLSGYSKVRLQGAGIEFRPVRANRNRGSTGGEFPVSDATKERLRDIMRGEFQKELERSTRFELTEETGPDVLMVWGGLLDVVSFVPTNQGGRDRVYLRSIGEATLVIELRDSESGERWRVYSTAAPSTRPRRGPPGTRRALPSPKFGGSPDAGPGDSAKASTMRPRCTTAPPCTQGKSRKLNSES
jgi:hypothetical protein